MSVPTVPPPLAHLGRRPFRFQPALSNVPENEWIYRRATWSEILVHNTKTQEEISIPRHFLGAISRVDEAVALVSLTKELECRAGTVWPVERRVIEMPRAVNDSVRVAAPAPARYRLAPVIGIRVESNTESRLGRTVLAGIALGIVGCVLAVSFYRGGVLGNRVTYTPLMQNEPGLGRFDDYRSVVRLLGPPAQDHWHEQAGLQFRSLYYPGSGSGNGFSIILAGRSRADARYIGAMDHNWSPIHAVHVLGLDNYALLRSLPRF